MNIENFAETVRNNVKKKLGDGYQLTVRKVSKNNGVPYIGLNVKKDGQIMEPLIYLNDHYKRYEGGSATLADIMENIACICRRKNPSVDIKQFLNYENVRKNIVFRLINTERNRELLEDIPHKDFMDLSIVFRYVVMEGEFCSASVLIHNVHMKLWDVTVDQLFREAEENTQVLEEFEIMDMKEVLRGIMRAENPETPDHVGCMDEFSDCSPMYVLSNKNRIEGSACLLYPDLVRDYADAIGSSFYIIPSSVHELLLFPVEHEEESGEIKKMIKAINDTQVAPEDILSYSLYYFDREEGRLCML